MKPISIPGYFLSIVMIMACSNKMNQTQKPVSLNEMLRKGEAVYFENIDFTEDIDLTALPAFNRGNKEKEIVISSHIFFKNCTFRKNIKAGDKQNGIILHFKNPVIFEACHFEFPVDLSRAVFSEKCSFKGSFFHDQTSFEGCFFRDEFDINQTLFTEEVKMQNITISGHLFFNDAQTKKNLLMQGSWIKGNFSCINSRTFGYVDLASCRVDGFFNGNYSQHSDRIVISNSFFNHRFELVGAFGDNLTIKECWFSGPVNLETGKFNSTTIRDNHERN